MARYIDAVNLYCDVHASRDNNPHTAGVVRINHFNEHQHFLSMIDAQPTADVEEVRHGKWETVKSTNLHDKDGNTVDVELLCKCSNCGGSFEFYETEHKFPSCPFCRAKMDLK